MTPCYLGVAVSVPRGERMNRSTYNFLLGYGAALNLFPAGRRYYTRRIRVRSDREAMAADWRAVGRDMSGAFGQVRVEDANGRVEQEREHAH